MSFLAAEPSAGHDRPDELLPVELDDVELPVVLPYPLDDPDEPLPDIEPDDDPPEPEPPEPEPAYPPLPPDDP